MLDVAEIDGVVYLSTEYTTKFDERIGRIFQSTDGGKSWSLLSEGYSGQFEGRLLQSVSSIRQLPSGRLIGSLGGTFGGNDVGYSDDGGATWLAFERPWEYPDGFRSAVLAGPRTLVASGTFYQPYAELWETTDGISWTRREEIAANDITRGPDGALYAIDSDDLLQSRDGGATWTTIGPSFSAFALTVDAEGFVYLAPLEGGVVRSTQPVAVATEGGPPASRLDLYVAPNPARASSMVTLALLETAYTRVEVVDLLGRVVAKLHAGPLAAGTHTLRLNTSLAAGAYVARGVVGNEVVTTRFVVVR
ncbi:MAG: sialidase family protein [Bacteroidota bacterium]